MKERTKGRKDFNFIILLIDVPNQKQAVIAVKRVEDSGPVTWLLWFIHNDKKRQQQSLKKRGGSEAAVSKCTFTMKLRLRVDVQNITVSLQAGNSCISFWCCVVHNYPLGQKVFSPYVTMTKETLKNCWQDTYKQQTKSIMTDFWCEFGIQTFV